MTKVDVVSGFLGAGKTTFIRHIARCFSRRNEKIVIIENEFGDTGIDGKMLELSGLEVYEIAQGCLCCSLKNDFVSTFTSIVEQLHPDRIIIEPSGIFILSEIYDIVRHFSFQEQFFLNSVITVIDSLNYLKQKKRYSFFFENQIRNTGKIVLSKTENVTADNIAAIMDELQKINPQATIYAASWSEMNWTDFEHIIEPNHHIQTGSELPAPKAIPHNRRFHRNFSGFGITPSGFYTARSLLSKLTQVSSGTYGSVLRVKGFVKTVKGIVEVNYVNGKSSLTVQSKDITPSLAFIGENLEKELLKELFRNIR